MNQVTGNENGVKSVERYTIFTPSFNQDFFAQLFHLFSNIGTNMLIFDTLSHDNRLLPYYYTSLLKKHLAIINLQSAYF